MGAMANMVRLSPRGLSRREVSGTNKSNRTKGNPILFQRYDEIDSEQTPIGFFYLNPLAILLSSPTEHQHCSGVNP
jgi:hypothetical protein